MASWLPWYPVLDYSLARDELAAQLASLGRQPNLPVPARALSASQAEEDDERIAASWGRPGGDVRYAIVPSEDVDPAVLRGAAAGREFACAHLGVATLSMRFYRPEGARENAYRAQYGVADWPSFPGPARIGHADRTTRTIAVRADIAPALAAEVAAHEVRHLTQPGHDAEADERDASAYGEWVAGVLVSHDRVVGVHRFDGFPYNFATLAGIAEPGDVVITNDAGTIGVFRNFGSRARPEWYAHHAACPVPVLALRERR